MCNVRFQVLPDKSNLWQFIPIQYIEFQEEFFSFLPTEYLCWAHSVDRDDRGITMRRFVDRHSARHLIDMRAMFCFDRSMRAMLRLRYNTTRPTREFRLLTTVGNRNPWENGQSCWYLLLGFAIRVIQEQSIHKVCWIGSEIDDNLVK